MIIDRYRRVHDYLRISLTDNCNLRCFYCMPEEDYEFTPHSKLMQPAEIEALAKIFVQEGVRKIRLTGGEPLIRKDAHAIIASIASLPVQLTLTTNGIRLHEFVSLFKTSGIRSLNISLDTLKADRFQIITRRDYFNKVMDNIALCVDEGFHVKVNMVVMKGFNDDEINDFVEWTRNSPIEVRFIEFMPFSGNRWTSNKVVTCHEILELIGENYSFERLSADPHDTAKHFKVNGHSGRFGVISTMSENFCGGCNRVRLTADGKLKNCLFSKEETDLLGALRRGDDISALIHANIQLKEKELGGQFSNNLENVHFEEIHNRTMISIGG